MDGLKDYFPDTVGLENPQDPRQDSDESENQTWFKKPGAIVPSVQDPDSEPSPQPEVSKPKRYPVPERKSAPQPTTQTDQKSEKNEKSTPAFERRESRSSTPNAQSSPSQNSNNQEQSASSSSSGQSGSSHHEQSSDREDRHRDHDSDKEHNGREGHSEHCDDHDQGPRAGRQPISVVLAPSQLTVPSQPWSRLTSPRSPYFAIAQNSLVAYQNDYAVVASRKYEQLAEPGKDEIVWDLVSPDASKNRTSRHTTGSVRFRLRNYGKNSTDKDSHHTIEVRVWDNRTPGGREMPIIDEPNHLTTYQAVAGFSTIDVGNYQFSEIRNGTAIASDTITVNAVPDANAEWVTRVLGKYNTVVAPFAAWIGDEWFVRKKEYQFHDPNAGTPTAKTMRVEWNWTAPASSKLNKTKFNTYLTVKYNYWTDGNNYRLITNVFDTLYPKGHVIKLQEGSGTLPFATLTYGVGLPTFGDFCIQEKIDGVETEYFALKSRYLSASADMPIVGYTDNGPIPISMEILTAPDDYILSKCKWKLSIKDEQTGNVVRTFTGQVSGNTQKLLRLNQDWDWTDSSGQPVPMGTIVSTELTLEVPKDGAAALAALPQCTKERLAGIRHVPECQKPRVFRPRGRRGHGGQGGDTGASGSSSEQTKLVAQNVDAFGSPGDIWVLASADPAIGVVHSGQMRVHKNPRNLDTSWPKPDNSAYEIYRTNPAFELDFESRRPDVPVTMTNGLSDVLDSIWVAFRTTQGANTNGFTSAIYLHNLSSGQSLPILESDNALVDNPEYGLFNAYVAANGSFVYNFLQLETTSQTITTFTSTRTLITSAGTNGAVGSRQTLNGQTAAPVRLIRPNGLFDSVYTDLAVNTGDFPLVIRRYWNPGASFDADENYATALAAGRFQWGWVYSFQRDLFVNADRSKVIHRKPEGGLDVYNLTGGTYKAARPDDTKVLTRNGTEYYLTDKSGHSYRFRLVEDQPKTTRAYLFEERDANENKLSYDYQDLRQLYVSKITSTHGQALNLNWGGGLANPIGLRYAFLQQVRDDSGRQVNYTYKALPFPLDYLRILDTVQQPGRTLSYSYAFDQFSRAANLKRPIPDWATRTPDNLRYYESIVTAFGRFKLASVALNGVEQTRMVGLDKFPAILDQVGHPGIRQYKYTQPTGSTRELSVVAATGTATQTWRHNIDPNHRVTKTFDPNGFSEEFSHDDAQNLVAHIDKTGKPTSYTYDARRNLTKALDEFGRETSYTYDAQDNLTEVKNHAGKTQVMTWDPERHLLSSHRDEELHTRYYFYDRYGHMTKHRTTLGYEWIQNYDQVKFFLESKVAPGGAEWHYLYDLLGRRTSTRLPDNHTIVTTYDVRDRVVRVEDAGRPTTSRYNANDQLTGVTDPIGRSMSIDYDAFWRPTTITQADLSTIVKTYDDFDNVKTVKNPVGAITSYTYDKANRLTNTTYPGPAGQESYDYNKRGQMTKWTKSDGTVIDYEFDDVGNLVKIKSGTLTLVSFDYDELNRVFRRTQQDKATDAVRSTFYNYSDASNLKSVTDNLGRTMNYTFDDDDRVTDVSDPEGKTMTYTYTPRNELKTASSDGLSATYDYNPIGTLSSINYNNGVSCALGYDNLSRLTQKAYRRGANPLVSHEYGYDSVDRKTSHRLVLPAAICNRVYTFNKLDQLTKTVQGYRPAGGVLTTTTIDYNVDSNNNVRDINQTNALGRTLSVNQADQTTSIANGNGNIGFDFDAAGSVKLRRTNGGPVAGPVQMKYDYKDQMTDWTQGSQNLALQYDSSNRLEKRSLNGQKNEFLWDGDQLYKEYGNDGAAISRYFLGVDREAVFKDGSWHLLLTDALGSVHGVTSSTGTLESSTIYSDYGQVEHTFGTTTIPYGWQGQRLDSLTGLHYMRNRWYDSNSCKFTARDPIRYGGGLNMYAFCSGDPINNTDPDGLQPLFLKPGPVILFSKPTIVPRPIPSTIFRTIGNGPKASPIQTEWWAPLKDLIPEDFVPTSRGRFQRGADSELQFDQLEEHGDAFLRTQKDFKNGKIDEAGPGNQRIIEGRGKTHQRANNSRKRVRTLQDARDEYDMFQLQKQNSPAGHA